MNELNREAIAYYPDDYRTYSVDKKAEFKQTLYEDYPHVKQLWKEWSILKGKLERLALNYPIQGTSAYISKMAALLIYNYRKNNNWPKFKLVNIIHDELITTSEDSESAKYLDLTKQLMIKAGTYFCSVPMTAEGVSSKNWKH
jgi:DNA polymerase I-like protein with 3'-5' exonuclease and polymerase domains